MKKRIVVVLALVVLVGLAVLGYQKFKPATPSPTNQVSSESTSPATSETAAPVTSTTTSTTPTTTTTPTTPVTSSTSPVPPAPTTTAPVNPPTSPVPPTPTTTAIDDPAIPPQTGLIVNTPTENAVVGSPLVVSGYVNGNGWIGFEGQVGMVKLVDANGHILKQKTLTATTDWMNRSVKFSTTLTFAKSSTKTGSLIFNNENPSGLPANDRQFILPVKFVE